MQVCVRPANLPEIDSKDAVFSCMEVVHSLAMIRRPHQQRIDDAGTVLCNAPIPPVPTVG